MGAPQVPHRIVPPNSNGPANVYTGGQATNDSSFLSSSMIGGVV